MFKHKTKDIEGKQVKVILDNQETVTQGMTTKVVNKKKRDGYQIDTLKCTTCGTENNYGELQICPKCKGTSFKKIDYSITKNKVADIINRKIKWVCKTCKKEYNQPTPCCNQKFVFDKKDINKWIQGYRCSACGNCYKIKIECCSGGELVYGKVFIRDPNAKIIVPISPLIR